MEKRRPTYDLEAIKLAIGSIDTLAITTSAFRAATSLGLAQFALAMHAGLTFRIPAAAATTARAEGVRGRTAR